jgi:two-component sensor histidine kinase
MIRTRAFSGHVESISAARHFVLDEIATLPNATRDDVSLMVSELASNATTHAGTAFEVTLDRMDTSLRVQVTDYGHGWPEPHHGLSPHALHGRGLLIVQALASRWGVNEVGEELGKGVWFEVAL